MKRARSENLKKLALEAFASHEIRERSDRSFMIQQRYQDDRGGWSSIFWAEAFLGHGGGIYVGGDIDTVMFAGGPKDYDARLRWMGAHQDVDYYVRQKAAIGSRGKVADVWEYDIAVAEVREWIAEERAERDPIDDGQDTLSDIEEWLGTGYTPESRDIFVYELDDVAPPNWLDDRWDVGMVTAPCVYYAWAAVRRICELRGLL